MRERQREKEQEREKKSLNALFEVNDRKTEIERRKREVGRGVGGCFTPDRSTWSGMSSS